MHGIHSKFRVRNCPQKPRNTQNILAAVETGDLRYWLNAH